jgi:putative ABC transport system permease protein
VQTTSRGYAAGRAAAVHAGSVVAPDAAPGLTDAAVSALEGAAVLPTTVYRGARPLTALGVEPVAFAETQRRMRVLSGSPAELDAPATAVFTRSALSEAAAGSKNAKDARTTAEADETADALPAWVRLTFADGEESELRVVAVVEDGSIRGDLLLSRETVRQHDPSALTEAVFVAGDARVPPGSGARVLSVQAYASELDAAEDRLIWVFTLLLIAVSAGYGAISVATTLLMAASSRRPDLRLLRRSGATSGQVRRMLAGEAAVIVTVGALLGGGVAAVGLAGIGTGLSAQMDVAVPVVVPWAVIGSVMGLCLLLAITAAVLPTFQWSAGNEGAA